MTLQLCQWPAPGAAVGAVPCRLLPPACFPAELPGDFFCGGIGVGAPGESAPRAARSACHFIKQKVAARIGNGGVCRGKAVELKYSSDERQGMFYSAQLPLGRNLSSHQKLAVELCTVSEDLAGGWMRSSKSASAALFQSSEKLRGREIACVAHCCGTSIPNE